MRSVFIFFKEMAPSQLRDTIFEEFGRSLQAHYDFEIGDDSNIWGFGYVTDDVNDFEDVDLQSVYQALGVIQKYVLVVDVTGKFDCRPAVCNFVKSLLQKHEGVVLDDYSSYAWRYDELESRNSEGREFFRMGNSFQ